MFFATAKDRSQIAFQGFGKVGGPAVLYLHGLGGVGSDWRAVLDRMPASLLHLCVDLRGHGSSDVSDPPYAMGTLISDIEAVCDARGIRDAVVVGQGVGGLIAQGLAIKRLDLVRGLILVATAAKLGYPPHWRARIDAAESGGMGAVAGKMAERWCGHDPVLAREWAARLAGMDPRGFMGVAAAISGTDFYTPTSGLRLPLLALAGSEDRATPPDLVRETANLVPGSTVEVIRKVGHQLHVEAPEAVGSALGRFLDQIGHTP